MEPFLEVPAFQEEPATPRALLWTLAALLVVAALGTAFVLWHQAHSDQETAKFLDAYAAAPDNTARLAVTKAHVSLPAAAPELLDLGGALLKSGNLEAAQQAFILFEDNFPHHPLIAGAWLGQAQVLMMQGKVDEALPLLQQITTSTDPHSEGFRAAALLAVAEIRQGKHDVAGARQALEELIAKFPSSAFVASAQAMLDSLR